jgi:hypothetical protein
MREYSEKFGINLEKVKQNLYQKYKIKSRKELTSLQLKKEIDIYQICITF